ncbi:MAG: hypothetical protein OXR67_03935 [Chloroflexota bacterium]|nr:hypothetical protein [Chloroflexota bacterium]
MKILLDHNTPHQLRRVLSEHEVHTAAYLGWSELENGDLLEAAASHGYDMIVTCDQSIHHEQNLGRYDVTLLTITSGNWNVIRQNIGPIRDAIETAVRGEANPVYLGPQA